MAREPPRRPEETPTPRPDLDTFRPSAGEDAYGAETVVKAVPRELLADLAAALRAPAVPNVEAKEPPRGATAKPAPPIADELTPLGEDDATVIDHRLDLDILAGIRHETTSDGERVPSPAPTPVVPAAAPASMDEPMPSSGRGAPPPDLSLPPPPPEPEPLASSREATPLGHVASLEIDENTDFRAGTRWPWITAIVVVVVSFAVTLAILRAF